MSAAKEQQVIAPCIGCGHAKRSHVNGRGLCLVKSCRMCLIYTPRTDEERRYG